MTGTRLAVIADDLTGALDSAAPFALAGLRTLVATSVAQIAPCLALKPEVLAINLGSREVPVSRAEGLAIEAAEAVADVPQLFKKIDSRMKGHIVAEVRAILARRGGTAILCPAIPELGRVVVGGHLTGAGVAQPLPVAREDWAAPDAATEADLDRIVASAEGALLVGARGLAAALARTMGRQAPSPPVLQRPLAFVVGSRDPISLAQVARLAEALPPLPCPDGEVPPVPHALFFQATPGPGADGGTVATRLALGALPHLRACRSMVLTGGETAAAVLQALGVGRLELLGEVATGLPLSRALDVPGQPLIVTKSGGFGAEDCLLTLFRASAEAPMQPAEILIPELPHV
ncbi:four-carbon acid sugar kinase family protein [Stagnihabitans tardus]|uniref:Four-carbon acid sugar kinase family protein n=1 Tax=Stagnihabitans tardus TaxID=2699202 RepID=A0AAE5BUN5_9RHOB|nr:four-carbon acid sugar kinase family protein [Stagnihabitans tardus]NBZ86313.1 hypothetical protein [Stagnihabitans tardus]